MTNVFNVSVYFIVFRESLEASIIVSVLLAFLKQGIGKQTDDPVVYKKLVRHVWIGSALGFLICLIIGGAFIGAWYGLGKDIWSNSEDIWEGVFSIIASIIISIMGLAMLRLNKMKEKWRVKIAKALEEKQSPKAFGKYSRKYAMAILPFITVLREGIEAIVFVGGVSISSPASAFPIPVICGLLSGCGIGFLMYKGGNSVRIQMFLIVATCFLYLVGAGLFSKAVWYFQDYAYVKLVGSDVSEEGNGPGSYDARRVVWHVNCCNGETQGGWMIFNGLFGWENSAYLGSVLAYNFYWIIVILAILLMLFKEKHGRYPLMKAKEPKAESPVISQNAIVEENKETVSV
ncbi:iron permease FTR1/Fip1/EfeU [Dipodascopsis uninucleata]